jgi:DNA polymerase-1
MPLLYRGHFIFMRNPRITSKGLNTSALYGFVNSLTQIIASEQPTHIAVVFDTKEPTFRHEMFPKYKAEREAMPEDIAKAIPQSHDLTRAFDIALVTCPGFEADDVIGTLATQAEKEGFETYMVTPDKDFGQLVSEHTFLYKPGKANDPPEIMGIKEITERWGIERVEQLIDVLGLAGDSVDNIPGVPGIGEKTAVKLLKEFDNMENLLANTASLKGKQKENLETFADQARLCRELATIVRDVKVDVTMDSMVYREPDPAKLEPIFRELEFESLGKKVFGGTFKLVGEKGSAVQGELGIGDAEAAVAEAPEINFKTMDDTDHAYHLVQSDKERKALVKRLEGAASFCFDLETTGLDARTTDIVGLAFAFTPHEAYYVPAEGDRKKNAALLEAFRSAFEKEGVEKIGHNLKFDIGVLQSHGLAVAGPLFDTMLAHYVIEPEQRHGMDQLARTYLAYSPVPITELIGERGKDQLSLTDIAVEKVADYAAEDADVTLRLRTALEPLLKENDAVRAFKENENPLIQVLVDMEAEGIRLDSEALREYSIVLGSEIETLEATIYKVAGTTFNIASPKQLGEIMFDYMKIEAKAKKTRTGQYQTNEEVLTRLAVDHEIAERVLEYRSRVKLKSTYVDALPLSVSPETGRIHTNYSQAATATGRIQSQHPNLQNIPIRTERGREIRKAFVPRDKEFLLMSADYSQIELRVMAELSGDKAMLATFREGVDIHAATAARVNGVPAADVTDEMRRQAKMVNFGIIYGISAFGLAQRLRISRNDAAEIISEYFKQYPDVKRYMDDTIAFAREHGHVRTLMGRRRVLPDIDSRNATVRQSAERNAINTPIQGTAADMIKVAMIKIHAAFAKAGLKSRMLLQVHDELVFDLHRKEKSTVQDIVEECMMTALDLKVPVVVDTGIGENWLEAH